MADQKKAQAEAEQDLKEKKSELDNSMNDIRIKVEDADSDRDQRSSEFCQEGTGHLILMNLLNFLVLICRHSIGHSMGGDSERTTWDFSKTVKENTFSRDYTFDVEKTAKYSCDVSNGRL